MITSVTLQLDRPLSPHPATVEIRLMPAISGNNTITTFDRERVLLAALNEIRLLPGNEEITNSLADAPSA